MTRELTLTTTCSSPSAQTWQASDQLRQMSICLICSLETDSQEIIDNVKAWLTEGSAVLHSTSRGWAHINNVNILIPSSWKNVSAQPGQSVHEDAQIRVETSSPVYGDSPFTVQTGDCGDQGEFIQVIKCQLQ